MAQCRATITAAFTTSAPPTPTTPFPQTPPADPVKLASMEVEWQEEELGLSQVEVVEWELATEEEVGREGCSI